MEYLFLITCSVEYYKIIHALKPYYYFPAEIAVFPKPDFNRYYNFAERKPRINFNSVVERFLSFIDNVVLPELKVARRLDLLDLLILRELERNALTTFKEISLRIKVTTGKDVKVSKISRHYNSHILKQELVKGSTLAYPPYYDSSSITILLSTLSAPEINYALANALSETFVHRVSFVSISSYRSIHMLTVPVNSLSYVADFVRKIRSMFNRLEIYVANRFRTRMWSIPYKLFNCEKKWWDLSLVEQNSL